MSNSRVTRLRVFAIESPSALDVLANRTESQTLQAVCKLLGHEFASTVVRSKTEFSTAVKHITSINEDGLSKKFRGRPLCLHLAAHGDKDGLELGPDSASWKYLAEKLRGFSCAMEQYSGPLLLIISACGSEDQKITQHFADYAKTTPDFRPAEYVFTTVGNAAGKVYWRDAVVAWAIFYHQIGSPVLQNREDIKVILDKVKLVGTGALKYFRWDRQKKKYVPFKSKEGEHKRP
jgi:hypothetical protein